MLKIRKVLTILLAIGFILTMTAGAVSAEPEHGHPWEHHEKPHWEHPVEHHHHHHHEWRNNHWEDWDEDCWC